MENTEFCKAYVEVTNHQTDTIGSGWGQADGCNENSCLDALNIAKHFAALDASCNDDSNCEVTHWAYQCSGSDFQNIDDGKLTSKTFDTLPNAKRGTKVPK